MVRRVIARLVSATALVAAGIAMTVGLAPAAVQAGPKVTALQIVAKDMPGGKAVIPASNRDLFELMYSEVSWLASATPQTAAPKSKALGPKYTVTVLIDNKPAQVYDLYPSATGGPRAHRGAKQPSGKKTDGWFYGRLTMSESLRLSGVPLKPKPDVVTGGIGGGVAEDANLADVNPIASVDDFLVEMRRLFLLNGAVLVVILFGLAGIAFLIRRKV